MNRKRHLYVHEWFAEIAAKHPERAAIDTGQGTISYRELQARARAVAAAVTDASAASNTEAGASSVTGAGASTARPVVVFTDRRADMIAALLGTLAAGTPFVPLTPDLPDARLREMVAIADPACVLTDDALVARYETNIAPQATLKAATDATTEATAGAATPEATMKATSGAAAARVLTFASLQSDAEFVAPELNPEHFCYIYFSSGSTGEPKGIAGRLKSIDHFIRWELNTLGLEAGARVSQLIAPTFDAFLRDVFVPLCSGGTICLPPSGAFLEGRSLADWLDAQQINLIHCVPSLWRTLFPTLGAERFPSLRHVLLSGEALRPSDVQLWHANFGTRIALVNLYGPSETTMTKFAYVVQAGDEERRTIPIGKPMPGVMAYLADEAGNPTSPVGEICIRTPFRSAGYYRRPDLTAQVFVKNPFGTDAADVIYKTGDIGRILEDGNYEFVGRRDGQVKLRGIRIDLGEIENAVVASGLAREAVAAVHEEDGGQTLCAYLILQDGADVRELRERLRERLPAALLPSVLVPLERIPTLPNGKADRLSLPNPKQFLAARTTVAAEPLNPIEEIIAGVWCKLLQIPSVRREESFFELGGHSLLAAQATARIGNALDMDVPLRLILQAPRLGDFARVVQELMKDYEDDGTDAPELVRADRDQTLPLSFAQRRLWFIDQLEPGNAAYNVPFAVRLRGQLNVAALSAALSEIVRRHEVLRTTFPTIDGQPVQLIHEARPVHVPVNALEHLPAGERERAARALTEEEAARPFDLATDSMLRTRLLRLSEQEHVLVVVMHHIVSDGWSTGVLVREFSQLYEAYTLGQSSPLAELPIQYADYAVWQRAWLQGEVLDNQLAYWREQLKDVARLELPTDAMPANERSGAVVRFELEADLTEALRELSRREGVTLFMVLMAAWQLLLCKYTGQEDVAVGTAVANRGQVEIEPLVGFFVNTLVLRGDLSGDPSFSELLRRVSATALAAYSHQELPFEKLVEELDPERDPTHNSLFQVAFAFENVPLPSFQLAGLEVDSLGVESHTSKFDLMLTLSESGGRLTGGLEYRTDLFARETVERMASHLSNIFQAVTTDAGQNLSSVGMLSPAEVLQLTDGWNDTATSYPKDSCIHQLFEQQAAHAPEATALEFGNANVSYGELNRRANQLAAYLRRRGVGAESRVGVLLERGAELVVALVAVLKAGAAYVPLDADAPRERIAYMLADAGVSTVVAQAHLASVLPEDAARVVYVDAEREEIAAESVDDSHATTSACNLAYVIYTSGSTGRPKGVAVPQRAVVRLVKETDYAQLSAADKVAQVSNASFDAATFEVWGALLNGATLVGIDKDVALAPRELAATVSERRITTIFLTTALFNQVVREAPHAFARVRNVLFGGEAVDAGRVRELVRADVAPERLLHVYGPTEVTTYSTWMLVADVADEATNVAIGRPIANTRAYVLDARMRPVALGVRGELYLGGDGLARGYVNEPRLTAERFVPDPFATQPGERLYRTGDIVRRLADGNLEFQGRRDGQVKLRGFRVEAGEIEAVLCEHEAVGECVVVVRECGESGKRLVAYVTPRNVEPADGELTSSELASGELRRYARARLPEYMIPSTFVPLARLPLNTNGKIDRAALPEPAQTFAAEAGHLAPRTQAEEILAGIWAELLGAERVGVRDDFFELGGHSLLATQVASRARAAFQIELPLRSIFENPVLEDLAACVANLVEEGSEAASNGMIYAAPTFEDEEVEALLAEIEQLSEEQARMELAVTAAAPRSTEVES